MKTRTSFLLIVSLIFGFLFCQSEVFAQKDKKSNSEKTTDTSNVLRYVDEMPEFRGGVDAMYAFLRNHLKYPAKAREKGIQGTVVVEFVIGKDGTVSNVIALVSVHPALDEEAIRVVEMMPKWKPGKQENKAVRVFYQLPIIFNLN